MSVVHRKIIFPTGAGQLMFGYNVYSTGYNCQRGQILTIQSGSTTTVTVLTRTGNNLSDKQRMLGVAGESIAKGGFGFCACGGHWTDLRCKGPVAVNDLLMPATTCIIPGTAEAATAGDIGKGAIFAVAKEAISTSGYYKPCRAWNFPWRL
jgi:hypothetical protein